MARPKKPLVSREPAIQVALQIIDRDGLESFSLARLAEELNVKAPSLYHHFRDRSDVLAAVARLIMQEVKEPRRTRSKDWKEALVESAVSARRAILRHPNAAALLLTYSPRHVVLTGYESWLRLMEKQGVPSRGFMLIIHGLDNLMMGSALTAAYAARQGEGFFPSFNSAEFPKLATAVKDNRMDDEEIFVSAARMLLRNIEESFA